MEMVTFACLHCETKLKVESRFSGRTVLCPKCRNKTPVPENEEAAGTYGVLTDAEVERPEIKRRTPAEIWKSQGYVELPDKVRADLGHAKAVSDDGDWPKAVKILNRLFRAVGRGELTRQNAPIRRPLAHCLVRWSILELRALDKENVRPSKPLRTVLKKTLEMKKWGGHFE